ncbi:MAG: transporter [Legionellales bacterium RIFCSPHIGHO2_12_FULL_42_9]|nr:MAG: transporter [Legionellales bacterium RIFCSPHIGHO2_12_FULL_42_9]
MKAWSKEKITPFALVLLITSAIDSVRNLPGIALFGSKLIFFFIFSAILFLIPVSLIAAELAAAWSEEEGGVYSWVKQAFGTNMAFLAIWLQWINTMVWYPTILSFIAGTFAYLIEPTLAQNKFYLISVILIVFWSLTFIGLSGIHTSANFVSFCTIFGLMLPMGFLIALALIWIAGHHPIAIDLSWDKLIPNWSDSQSWVSLTAIMTSFLGMELAAVHVRNVRHPQKNFPRALFFSALLILFTMILGSLSIAMVLPKNQISLVGGVIQAFTNFLDAYHWKHLMPVVTVLLLIGSVGGMINWIISPAKGLLLAADHGFLPHWLYRLNRHGVASRVLIMQAVLVTLLCSAYFLLPSINGIYWLFTALSTELYMVMYVLMFIAAVCLKRKFPNRVRPFKVAGGNKGYYLACFLGLIGALITLVIGFIPPTDIINFGWTARYQSLFSCGILFMILPSGLFYFHKYRVHKKENIP